MYYPSIFKKTATVAIFSLLFSATAFALPAPPAPVILAGSWYVDNITQSSATVHFKTDGDSQGSVQYCSDPAVPGSCRFANEAAGVIGMSHSVPLSGLLSDRLYYYQLLASYGDESSVGYYPPSGAPINNWPTFRTLAVPDVAPPVISNVRASAGETSAQIEYETNEDGTTGAMYFPAGGEPIEAAGPGGYARFHVMTLIGLTPDTLYYYNPYSADRDGHGGFYIVGAADWPTFHTTPTPPAPGDTSAPRIENIKVTDITQTSAVVNWATRNADGSPDVSNSFVEYCKSADRATCLAVSNVGYVETHALTLSGLSQNTRYYYEIRSTDPAGNMSVYPVAGTPILDRPNFITQTAPPVVGGGVEVGVGAGDHTAPTISNIKASVDANVTITWDTDEDATSIVDFATDVNYRQTGTYSLSAGSGTLVASHRVVLMPSNLQPNTLYHYRVRSADQVNNIASSSDLTFRTRASAPTPAPAVSGGTTTSTGTQTVTSPGASTGTEQSEVKPFNETVFEPEPESSSKYPILAFLFVLFGAAMVYVLARRKHPTEVQ